MLNIKKTYHYFCGERVFQSSFYAALFLKCYYKVSCFYSVAVRKYVISRYKKEKTCKNKKTCYGPNACFTAVPRRVAGSRSSSLQNPIDNFTS